MPATVSRRAAAPLFAFLLLAVLLGTPRSAEAVPFQLDFYTSGGTFMGSGVGEADGGTGNITSFLFVLEDAFTAGSGSVTFDIVNGLATILGGYVVDIVGLNASDSATGLESLQIPSGSPDFSFSGPISGFGDGPSGGTVVVPEPATMALFATGLVLLMLSAGLLRRPRKAPLGFAR